MELLAIITTCFLLISFMFVHCASYQVHEAEKSLDKVKDAARLNRLATSPTKLKLVDEEVKNVEQRYFRVYRRIMEASSSGKKLYQKEKSTQPEKRTAHHLHGEKKSEYFTMDYSWVRRRRPIHNKNVPVGP